MQTLWQDLRYGARKGEPIMRFARIIPAAFALLAVCAFAQQSDSQTPARVKRVVMKRISKGCAHTCTPTETPFLPPRWLVAHKLNTESAPQTTI